MTEGPIGLVTSIADACAEVIRTRALTSTPVDFELVRKWAAEWQVEQRLEEVLSRVREPRR